jgi:hypothetical protein
MPSKMGSPPKDDHEIIDLTSPESDSDSPQKVKSDRHSITSPVPFMALPPINRSPSRKGFDESTLEMSCDEKSSSGGEGSEGEEFNNGTATAPVSSCSLAVKSAVHADFLHALVVQFSGDCLVSLLKEVSNSLGNIVNGISVLPQVTRMSSAAAKCAANEKRHLFMTEAIMQLSEVTAEVVALQSRLLLAGSLKDQQLDPRCNAFRFRDRHFRVEYPVYEQVDEHNHDPFASLASSSSSSSNDYGGFTGVRIVS